MTTAVKMQQTTLEASTHHTPQLDTSDKQRHYHASTNTNHYLEKEQRTQHHGTTAATTSNSIYERIQRNCALT